MRRIIGLRNDAADARRSFCLAAAYFSVLAAFLPTGHAATVWIDTDVAIKSPIRDADDAFALAAVAGSSEIHVAGISTSYGNGPLSLVDASARELVAYLRGDTGLATTRIYPGADSPNSIATRSQATEALAFTLKRERLTYVALGPLTNLAAFLKFHPSRTGNIDRIIFVGGQLAPDKIAVGPFHVRDANMLKDPAAVRAVLRSGIPVVLISVTVASQLRIDAQSMKNFGSSGPVGDYIQSKTRAWFWYWTSLGKMDGAPVFDALAIMVGVEPRLVSLQKRRATLDPKNRLIIGPLKDECGHDTVLCCTAFARRDVQRSLLRRLLSSSR